jgi:hypothetical protein
LKLAAGLAPTWKESSIEPYLGSARKAVEAGSK